MWARQSVSGLSSNISATPRLRSSPSGRESAAMAAATFLQRPYSIGAEPTRRCQGAKVNQPCRSKCPRIVGPEDLPMGEQIASKQSVRLNSKRRPHVAWSMKTRSDGRTVSG
jgi:hypothetical protein